MLWIQRFDMNGLGWFCISVRALALALASVYTLSVCDSNLKNEDKDENKMTGREGTSELK